MSALGRIGHTPLLDIDGIHVKLECANPGGSIKDRIARFMLEEARRRGELRPGDVIVEATSGNTGIALAMVGAELGHRVILFLPEHMSVERVRMMEKLGAELRLTSRAASFAGAVAERDRYRGRPGYYVPDQFGNPDNVRCHELTTGAEILAQLGRRRTGPIGHLVAGVGTGGTLMGIGAALKKAMPGIRIVAVEPDESAVLSGGPAGEHGIQGIGDGFVPALLDRARVDDVVRVTSDEAHLEAERIRRELGYCVGRSAGANLVAARRLRARGGEVVTVWPDCGDRYVSLGLRPPSAPDVSCPLRAECTARSAARLPAAC